MNKNVSVSSAFRRTPLTTVIPNWSQANSNVLIDPETECWFYLMLMVSCKFWSPIKAFGSTIPNNVPTKYRPITSFFILPEECQNIIPLRVLVYFWSLNLARIACRVYLLTRYTSSCGNRAFRLLIVGPLSIILMHVTRLTSCFHLISSDEIEHPQAVTLKWQ